MLVLVLEGRVVSIVAPLMVTYALYNIRSSAIAMLIYTPH
jgi:hypothetical protein